MATDNYQGTTGGAGREADLRVKSWGAGGSTRYKSIDVPLDKFGAHTGTPTLGTVTMTNVAFPAWAFATGETISAPIISPDDLDSSVSNPTYWELLWTYTDSNSGNVDWNMALTANIALDNANMDANAGTFAGIPDGTTSNEYTHRVLFQFTDSVTPNTLNRVEIARDSTSDTKTGDAYLYCVRYQYPVTDQTTRWS